MLPSLGIVALLAGVAFEALAVRRPRLALIVAAATLAFPLHASWRYLEAVARPSTRDRAAAWLALAVPAPARVLTTLPSLRVDPRRFEVQRVRQVARSQVLNADAVVTTLEDEAQAGVALAGLPPATVLRPVGAYEGLQLFVRLVPPALRPSLVALPLAEAELRVSAHSNAVESLRDGCLDSAWRVGPDDARGAWIELRLPAPARIARVELLLGEHTDEAALNLRLRVSADGARWRPHDTLEGRPAPDAQLASVGCSEVLLFDPVEVRGLRLERRAGARPWSVAELRVFASP